MPLTRRALLQGALGFATASCLVPRPKESPMSVRMPVVFLPHGGGPWPFMDDSAFGPPGMFDGLRAYLQGLGSVPPEAPRAVLVVSAHWEERSPTVMTAAKPPMFYDYYGFPPHTYEIEWPAPGEPEVAALVRQELSRQGIESAVSPERGFDHGTFVPLMLSWPDADVPTFQLSLCTGLDPAEHLRIGRALAPLRDRGVFIVGSGMSYHNMEGFFGRVRTAAEDSEAFDDWLAEAVAGEPSLREQRLAEWSKGPRARACHPREEHLLPLMVCSGAAGDDVGTVPYRDELMGVRILAAHFA